MTDLGTKRCFRLPMLAAALFLALTGHPAFGLRIDRYEGCGELCREGFWQEADAQEVASALDDNPLALQFLRTILWHAVEAKDPVAVAELLRAGAPPNARRDRHGGEFILNAAVRLDDKVVLALLEGGAFPNVADEHGWTVLHSAVKLRRTGAVAALLDAGADPRAADEQGVLPLDLIRPEDVGHGGAARDIHELLRSASSPSPRCGALCDVLFWKTATTGQIRNAAASSAMRPVPGGGPLHAALSAGRELEVVALLLDLGVDPNGRNASDDTPLHAAARVPSGADALRLLLDRGAILNAVNESDQTALHVAAARAATVENMRVLLDAGANPDSLAGYTLTHTPRELAAMHPEGTDAADLILEYRGTREFGNVLFDMLLAASGSGHPETVELLVGQGADPTEGNIFGNTPLHMAARAGNLGTMRALLEFDADPNWSKYDRVAILSGEGERPLHAAVGHPQAVALLLQHGANPNGRVPTTGNTALHLAAVECDVASLALLLEHGAEPNARNGYDQTPLHDAVAAAGVLKNALLRPHELLDQCEWDQSGMDREACEDRVAVQVRGWHETLAQCRDNIPTLIRYGADPNAGGEFGLEADVTPLDLAERYGLEDPVMKMMRDADRIAP